MMNNLEDRLINGYEIEQDEEEYYQDLLDQVCFGLDEEPSEIDFNEYED